VKHTHMDQQAQIQDKVLDGLRDKLKLEGR
jgi:hypothetical protein